MGIDSEYQICNHCVMDTSDPDIRFDKNGVCNHCTAALINLKSEPYCLTSDEKERRLKQLFDKIIKERKKNRYDCIIGVSGGVDSTYVAFLLKSSGLNPLAVHLDNGWDSELAVQNIFNICDKLKIDLYTHVIDWDEFKDLQMSFLKASTPDSEIPSDHAIYSIMYKMAEKEKVNYIIAGYNIASESILPKAWSQGHFDWKYINRIQKRFGTKKLTTYPHYSLFGYLHYLIDGNFAPNVKMINILDYIQYNKNEAKKIIMKELGWRDYGGKHCESNYTKIYQSYILPVKFGYDKRRAHLSSLICSAQLSRDQALEELQKPLYPEKELNEDLNYLTTKFNISRDDFSKIMTLPLKTYNDYPNYLNSWYVFVFRAFFKLVRLIQNK